MPGRFLKSACSQVVALALTTPVAAHSMGVVAADGHRLGQASTGFADFADGARRDSFGRGGSQVWVSTPRGSVTTGTEKSKVKSRATSSKPSAKATSKPSSKASSSKAPSSKAPSSKARSHVVRAGETLSSIGRRYRVTAGQLMKANGLSASAVIRPGQKLVVPGGSAAAVTSAPEAGAVRGVAGAGASVAKSGAAAAESFGRHTVKKGETVRKLAAQFGTTQKEFMRLNNLKDATKLRAGAVVRYPVADEGAALMAATDEGPVEERLPAGWQWHTVERGESLSQIAARHGQERAVLERANVLAPGNPIHEGMRLKIPPPGVVLDPPSSGNQNRPPAGSDHSVLAYQVQKGDTFEGLAEVFLTTPDILRQLNRLPQGGTLATGQRIVVPNNLFE